MHRLIHFHFSGTFFPPKILDVGLTHTQATLLRIRAHRALANRLEFEQIENPLAAKVRRTWVYWM